MAHGNGIGTPAQLRDRLRQYQDAGVDQVIFVQQAGRNKHEHIIDSLKLFAAEVMPVLKQEPAERDRRKQADLAPYIAAALQRKQWMQPLPREQIPVIEAYGRSVVATSEVTEKPDLPHRRRRRVRGADGGSRGEKSRWRARNSDVRVYLALPKSTPYLPRYRSPRKAVFVACLHFGGNMFHQLLTPIGGSLPLSFLVAALPIAVVLVMLGVLAPPGLAGLAGRRWSLHSLSP